MHRHRLPALAVTIGIGLLLSCGTREVSVAAEEGQVCGDESGGESGTCARGFRCEPVAGGEGEKVCALPLLIRGEVLNALTGEPVRGALVMALDGTGAPVSDTATSDSRGSYELELAALRDYDGQLAGDAAYTLQVFAQDYAPFPFGVRPAMPINADERVRESTPGGGLSGDSSERFVLETETTTVPLLPLDDKDQDRRGTIHGTIPRTDNTGDLSEGLVVAGTLVVAEGADIPAPYGIADRSGEFTIFNVSPGSVTVSGYRAGIELSPLAVDVTAGSTREAELSVTAHGDALASVRGTAGLVDDAAGTVEVGAVLIPFAVFHPGLGRGPVPVGLRVATDAAGDFTISEVPAGRYRLALSLENDALIGDPASAERREITVASGETLTLPDSLPLTNALAVISPGSDAPQAVSGKPTFEFAGDADENRYVVVLYDGRGELVWEKKNVVSVGDATTVEVKYGGPKLVPGMWFQFSATSVQGKQDAEIRLSRTEDLRGVFFAE